MPSGLDDFKALLKDVSGLSVWAIGAGVGAPFAAALTALAPPPWPKSIALITSIMELIVLICVFQFFATALRQRVNRLMLLTIVLFAVAGSSYLVCYNRYTFEVPTNHARGVMGFVCTDEARLVYGEDCQDKPNEKLASAEYEASRIWKAWSIDRVTYALNGLWLFSFGALSFTIGLFVVFQSRQPARQSEAAPAKGE